MLDLDNQKLIRKMLLDVAKDDCVSFESVDIRVSRDGDEKIIRCEFSAKEVSEGVNFRITKE